MPPSPRYAPRCSPKPALPGEPIVGVGGHDHVVGMFAAGITAPGTLLDSLGTAEALIFATEATLTDPEVLKRGYFQGAIATNRELSFVGAGISSSGGALEWCRAPDRRRSP